MLCKKSALHYSAVFDLINVFHHRTQSELDLSLIVVLSGIFDQWKRDTSHHHHVALFLLSAVLMNKMQVNFRGVCC